MANLKSWASVLDDKTRLQAETISRAPGLAGHVALMPDAHLGMGATVGSVVPTFADTIIPAAVGVDIGCGMMACRLDMAGADLPDDLSPLVHAFGRSIPSGLGRQHRKPSDAANAWFDDNPIPHPDAFASRKRGAARAERYGRAQLGTLGSGNHFVELCVDDSDSVWCLLHSGSRNIGNAIAQIFTQIAQRECEEKLEDRAAARLTGESFERYIDMMGWAQRYAFRNRELMMDAMLDDILRFLGGDSPAVVETINCHHNFATLETHFGQQMWITRKGAIKADVGDMGIIPSSMAGPTFIVEGLGNADAYNSAPHGCGRVYSRTAARRSFSEESLRELMRGKAWNERQARKLLDEHPDAYKDPEIVVKEDSRDLARVVATMTQRVNYKGT